MDKWKCRVSSFAETRNEWINFKWWTWKYLTTINETYSAGYKQIVSPRKSLRCGSVLWTVIFEKFPISIHEIVFVSQTNTRMYNRMPIETIVQTNWAILLRIKGTTLSLSVFITHRRQVERECAWTNRFGWWTDYTIFQCIVWPFSSTGVPFLLTLDLSFCRDNSENIGNYPIPALNETMHEWIQWASSLRWDVFSKSVWYVQANYRYIKY